MVWGLLYLARHGKCIMLLPLFLFALPFLTILGQSPNVVDLIGLVAILLIPMHFSLAFQFLLQTFLHS